MKKIYSNYERGICFLYEVRRLSLSKKNKKKCYKISKLIGYYNKINTKNTYKLYEIPTSCYKKDGAYSFYDY